MGLSQHSIGVGFLAWVSLVPFLFIIQKIESYIDILKYFFIWGFIFHLTSLFWLSSNMGTSRIVAIISMFATVFCLSTNTWIIGLVWYRL